MSDALEKRLIKALKSVDAHGDVAPTHVHDPMTMLLRENAIQANLMRWDDVRGRYVLTGTGRRRTIEGSRAPGTVVSFRKRGSVAAVRCTGNPPTPISRNSARAAHLVTSQASITGSTLSAKCGKGAFACCSVQ